MDSFSLFPCLYVSMMFETLVESRLHCNTLQGPGFFQLTVSNITLQDPGTFQLTVPNITLQDPGTFQLTVSNITLQDPGTFQLTVSNVTVEDNGTYICQVNTEPPANQVFIFIQPSKDLFFHSFFHPLIHVLLSFII